MSFLPHGERLCIKWVTIYWHHIRQNIGTTMYFKKYAIFQNFLKISFFLCWHFARFSWITETWMWTDIKLIFDWKRYKVRVEPINFCGVQQIFNFFNKNKRALHYWDQSSLLSSLKTFLRSFCNKNVRIYS